MKSLIQSAIRNTNSGNFLIRKCSESNAWALSVTIVGIACIVGVCLI